MVSKIEETIEELEEYIESCKPSAFSSSKIVVNRDELEVLISELKAKIPEEVNRYQKIINNKEAILAQAKAQAQEILDAAKIHTNELVSEHQIMREAYKKANEVVGIATKDAQDTLDSATRDANEIRRSAIAYTDELLTNVQEVLVKSIDQTRMNQDAFLTKMQGYLDTVVANRVALSPNPIVEDIMSDKATSKPAEEANKPAQAPANQQNSAQTAPPQGAAPTGSTMQMTMVELPVAEGGDVVPGNTGVIDIPEEFFKKD